MNRRNAIKAAVAGIAAACGWKAATTWMHTPLFYIDGVKQKLGITQGAIWRQEERH